MRRKLTTLGVFIALVALLIVFLLSRGRVETVNLSAVVTNLSGPVSGLKDDESLYLSNGRYFVRYNPATNKTSKMSPDIKLPDILEIVVAPNKQDILFKTKGQTFNDDLYGKITKEGVDPARGAWWLYTAKDKMFRFVSNNITDVDWASDSKSFYAAILDSIRQYELDLSSSEVHSLNGVRSVKAVSDYLFAYTSDKTVYKSSTTGTDLLADAITGVVFGPDGRFVGKDYDEGDGAQDLKLFEAVSTNKSKKLGTTQEDNYSWPTNSEGPYYIESSQFLTSYLPDSGKFTRYVFTSGESTLGSPSILAQTSNGYLLVEDSSGVDYLANQKGGSLKEQKVLSNERIYVGETEVLLSQDSQSVVATVTGKVTDAKKQQVYKKLSSLGYQPDLLTIRFSGTELMFHPN